MSFRKVTLSAEHWPGEMVGTTVDRTRVLLVNLGGTLSAFEDRCAHAGVPLSHGRLQDGAIICPVHEWCYDAHSGCGINPVHARLRRFPVRMEAGEIWIDLEAGGVS